MLGLKEQLDAAGFDTSNLNEDDLIKKLDSAGFDTSSLSSPSNNSLMKDAVSSTPQEVIKQLTPSNSIPAATIPMQEINKTTGIDLTNTISPVQNIPQAIQAIQHPIQSAQAIGSSLKRGAEALVNPKFSPTESEKLPMKIGKWGGIALELAAMPSNSIQKEGLIDKASETLDSIAGVPRGSSFALLKNPSKWLDIFTSKSAVREAYQKAVQAGEDVAEKADTMEFLELAKRAKMTAARTVDDLAEEVAPLVQKAEEGTTPLKTATPMLVRFRKAANEEIGRLKKMFEKGIGTAKSQESTTRRLASYQEMAKRVNSVLDQVAPKFRAADAVKRASMEMQPFRSGIKPLLFGTADALAGTALKQGYRSNLLMSSALDSLANKRKR